MRYKKMLAAVMSAVMVLAGCNAGAPADKSVEAVTTATDTSPVTEEVTTTTTMAEVTTTSAALETTASEETPEEGEWHLEPFYDPELYEEPGFVIVGTTPKVFEIPAECNWEPVNRIYFRGTCDNLKTEKLILPDTLEYIQPDPNWRSLTEICVSENSPYLSVDDGILYSKDKSVLYMYPSGRENVEFTVPDFVSSIAKGAFENALYLKKITIPDTVLDIRSQAFRDSVLEEISLENAVETIGAGAFWACRKLKKIEIPASVKKVGEGCFEGCEKLETVILDSDPDSWGDDIFSHCFALKEVILNGTQKYICYDDGVLVNKNDAGEIVNVIRALPDTCPESYEMPKTAKRIDAHAFYGCKSLKTVIFPAEIDYEPMDGFCPYEGFIGCDNIKEVYVYSDKFRYSGGQMFPKGTVIHTYEGYPAAERAEKYGFKVVYLNNN